MLGSMIAAFMCVILLAVCGALSTLSAIKIKSKDYGRAHFYSWVSAIIGVVGALLGGLIAIFV